MEEGPSTQTQLPPKEWISKRTFLFFMVFLGMNLIGVIEMNLLVENALIFGKDCTGGVLNTATEYVSLFYLAHTLPQIICGRIADIFGGRKVFGLSILIVSCFLTIFPPAVACGIGHVEMDAMRLLMSTLLAPVCTAVVNIMSKWIPPNERGWFASNLFAINFGSALFILIPTRDVSQYGMGVLCYTTALFGFIWSYIWFTFIEDSPIIHPNISTKEKMYILEATTKSGTIYEPVTPQWIDMLCSKQVWVIIVTDALMLSALYFISEPAVTMVVQNANAANNCWLYSISPISTYLVSLISGIVCDYCLSRGKMKIITARKSFTCFAAFATSITHSVILFSGGRLTHQQAVLFVIGNGFIGSISCGVYLAFNDFAPNFAATLYGITEFSSGLFTGVIKKVISEIEFKKGPPLDKLLCLSISILLTSSMLYLIFGKSELVRWNQHYKLPRSSMRDNRSKYIIVKRDSNNYVFN